MKSKTSATTIVITTMVMGAVTGVLAQKGMAGCAWRRSGALQQNGFKHVGRIFGFISGCLQNLVELLQLDQMDRVLFLFEKFRNRFTRDLVRKILQPVHLDAMRHDVAVL